MIEHFAILVFRALEIAERRIAHTKEHHKDDGDRSGPRRDGFGYPQQNRHHENGDYTLLNDGESLDSKEVSG